MSHYEVVVGNVGTVCRTENGAIAYVEFGQWKKISMRKNLAKATGCGRAAGEPVSLFKDGEIKFDYQPGDES